MPNKPFMKHYRPPKVEGKTTKAGQSYRPVRMEDFRVQRLNRAHLKDRLVWKNLEGMLRAGEDT